MIIEIKPTAEQTQLKQKKEGKKEKEKKKKEIESWKTDKGSSFLSGRTWLKMTKMDGMKEKLRDRENRFRNSNINLKEVRRGKQEWRTGNNQRNTIFKILDLEESSDQSPIKY